LRDFFGADGFDRIPQQEGEVLIRAVLDESVEVPDFDPNVVFAVHCLVFVGLAMDLEYAGSKLDALLVRAEEAAVGRGFSPTLASSAQQ
jgi:hypothetical protein